MAGDSRAGQKPFSELKQHEEQDIAQVGTSSKHGLASYPESLRAAPIYLLIRREELGEGPGVEES